MELKVVDVKIPENANVIIGQSHFIKTVEDLYEIFKTHLPNAKFGIAFSEASGPCLIRREGNDEVLVSVAVENAMNIACGHIFVIVMRDAYPINILNSVKQCQEVANIFCATANPLQVIVVETEKGRGIIGVIDGSPPNGVEGDEDVMKRKEFLRRIGYKL
ncbi:MAG: adenosine-specific kinase [Deltaproteobacteria bacterium]|nr:adenosine-specific kinase [Deltaproteobacteria bacterium]